MGKVVDVAIDVDAVGFEEDVTKSIWVMTEVSLKRSAPPHEVIIGRVRFVVYVTAELRWFGVSAHFQE